MSSASQIRSHLHLPLPERARLALTRAFARVVHEHRQTGLPLVLWRDGKVVHVPAEQLAHEVSPGDNVYRPSDNL